MEVQIVYISAAVHGRVEKLQPDVESPSNVYHCENTQGASLWESSGGMDSFTECMMYLKPPVEAFQKGAPWFSQLHWCT